MRTRLHDLLIEQAGTVGSRPAVTFKEVTLDHASLAESVLAFAGGLSGLGLARGERVAIVLEKRIETVVALLGTSAADGVFVPVNPILKAPQVSYVLADCDVTVLVTTEQRWLLLAEHLAGLPALAHVVLVDAAPDGPGRAVSGDRVAVHDFEELLRGERRRPAHGVDLDMAAILYTSGSTGRPKGVVLSHRNLIVGAESVSHYLGNDADDVILAALPFSFDAGLSQLTTALAAGAHLVLMNYLFPGDVVRLCEQHGVTGLTCVPPLWIQLAEHAWPHAAAARLRYFANTGGRMPRSTLERLRGIFPQAAPFLMYGLTEAFRSTYLDPAEVDRRPDSIGRAIPNAEILVVRPDGSRCEPGEEGELVHRGPLVALGYWQDAERTAERFRPVPGADQPWRAPELAVWSGDTVVADEDGFLYFVGRTDDMIKTSGYRVSPTEIEEAAYETGLVRDAVAVGVPDERLGQRVVLVVTTSAPGGLDVEAVQQSLRQALPLFMVPGEVQEWDEMPRSANGKFDRPLIRDKVTP
ncbi:acyl-CoA ligase (AMP-forming), exosortase A system-associated [Nocardioides sp. LS1]|uniref:acyl-CoA ligase (AMP-forming), exosortase A system-associated n=1 Tax=Nocardioides sp. LS1 TaxID=1027620 RepID=UPI000F61D65D|nr:acyl-CoA ligase (AMP-forming), exosortase A system-associated [Nocardioides sp. LS1]GCD91326.1 acyl-CoA ligase (AMP-forming), exosortase A system-associated [Nocardioides sp. LS1]